jgi:hypothetical protein
MRNLIIIILALSLLLAGCVSQSDYDSVLSEISSLLEEVSIIKLTIVDLENQLATQKEEYAPLLLGENVIGCVTDSPLSTREGPGFDFEELKTLASGICFMITGVTEDMSWGYSVFGWVYIVEVTIESGSISQLPFTNHDVLFIETPTPTSVPSTLPPPTLAPPTLPPPTSVPPTLPPPTSVPPTSAPPSP